MSIRFRTTALLLLVAAAGLTACTDTGASPLEPRKHDVNADVDTLARKPTIPWT